MIKTSRRYKHILSYFQGVLASNSWFFMVASLCHGLIDHCILLVCEAYYELDRLEDLGVVTDCQGEVQKLLLACMDTRETQYVPHLSVLDQFLCSEEFNDM